MKSKPQTRYIITFIVMFFSSHIAYAETDARLEKTCERQATFITGELKSDKTYSVRDLNMIRLGAVRGCMSALQDTGKSTPAVLEPALADNKKTAEKDIDADTKPEKKDTLLDRLLRSEPKKDVNPMQKQHRTGGK